jgi:hypothetical protein
MGHVGSLRGMKNTNFGSENFEEIIWLTYVSMDKYQTGS